MKISVYITSYNQKAYLVEAIESVLAQTLRPHEIIIVDDASSDGSQEVIKAYATRHPDLVRPVLHTRNTGVARARTDALNSVTGDYVTYVDGDDRCLPTKLEKETGALARTPSAQIAFSNYYYIDEEGRRRGVWADEEKPPTGDVFCETYARAYPRRNLFRTELVNYRAWKRIGFYDPGLVVFEDYDMRIRLTSKLRTTYCDEPLGEYRRHGGGLSSCARLRLLKTAEVVCGKNRPLLASLPLERRRWVERELSIWLANLSGKVARDAVSTAHLGLAAACYLKSLSYGGRPVAPVVPLVPARARWLLRGCLPWVRKRLGSSE
jgi:glycosyltransferase involved in cell wall biosynthesis